MESLYNDVRALSSQKDPEFTRLADGLNATIRTFATNVVESFPDAARAAASVGSTRIDILRFQGGDLDEASGFPILTVVKGPRDPDLKALVPTSLLDALRTELKPFRVFHVWNTRTNVNRVVISWEDDEPHQQHQQELMHDARPPRRRPPAPVQLHDLIRLALAKSGVPP